MVYSTARYLFDAAADLWWLWGPAVVLSIAFGAAEQVAGTTSASGDDDDED